MRSVFAIFMFAMMAASCGQKCLCPDEQLIPAFVSYADSEIDTIIITRFQRGTNFSVAVDSFSLHPGNSIRTKTGDTTMLIVQPILERLTDRFDVRLFNPFDGRTILISDVEIETREINCGGIFSMDPQPCTSPITGFRKNGAAATLDQSLTFRGLIIRK